MAATLTDDLTRVSVAEIEKWDEGPDGTVYVYGRCTTPEVDTDEQVVDSGWSGPALKEYLATAPTVRVQHNPQRDPAGSAVRVDVNRDGDGAHWLKAAVDEPVAQRLVKKGHLRAFSVGIARPVVERDMTGKARGGIIKGGKIVEVSLVDSPANRSCFLEIAKSAADGTCEFTGKVVAEDDVLQKALGADLVKSAAEDDFVNVDLPKGASISISPADFAKLHTLKKELTVKAAATEASEDVALKAVMEAETPAYKRDIDTATRRRLAGQGRALSNLSYPVENHGDADNAVTLALSGHGDAAAAKQMLRRIAREEGWQDILDRLDGSHDSTSKGTVTETGTEAALGKALAGLDAFAAAGSKEEAVDALEAVAAAVKEAEPDVTKDPEPEDKPQPARKAKKKAKGPKKLPPWLNKPDSDGDGDDDSSEKACKSVTDHLWTGVEGTSDIVCSKCHTTPAEAAGVTASQMDPAPVGELQESQPPMSVKSGPTPASASGAAGESMNPVPAHREPDGAPMEALERDAGLSDGDDEKPTRLEAATGMKAADLAPDPEVAALLRFKAIGADEDMGRLHDLTCPAYHPEDVARYHPFADLGSLIDSRVWQRKALASAVASGPVEESLKGHQMWEAALLLKTADPADVNDWRLAAYKAFRDANPGPGTFPTPGSVSPQRYSRPVLSDGRGANGVDYAVPNTAPQVATAPPNAQNFDRPPLAAAHQSPSPSHMKWDSGEYPSAQGQPTQLSYAQMQKEHQRMALVRMHDHLSRQFPEVCPLNTVNSNGLEDRPLRGVQPEGHPVPAIAGIGKSEAAQTAAPAAAKAAAAPDTDVFGDDAIYKGFKKVRKKLGKKVLAGKMTVDEARAVMGRQFAQKGAGATVKATEPVADWVGPGETIHSAGVGVAKGADPEVIKAAVAEAIADAWKPVPLEAAELKSFDMGPSIEAAVTKALVPVVETFTTKLAEQQRVIDAIADQPDPSTAAFSGLAFQPKSIQSRRPAAVPDQAEYAARAQAMVRRNLQHTYETHSDPYVREAAGQSLASMGVGTGMEAS